MNLTNHSTKMKALTEYTATSFYTDYPSPFGAAIYEVSSGILVAQSYDTVMRDGDLTNHAEMNAIRIATKVLGRLSLRGHILYSTCEPCPMCMSACIWAELDGVVFGASTMEDANKYWPQGSDIMPEELISHMKFEPKCLLIRNVERELCQRLFDECELVRRNRWLELPPNRI